MTFKILTEVTNHVVHWSILWPATDNLFKSQCMHFNPKPDIVTLMPEFSDPNTGKSCQHRAPLKFDHGLSHVPRPKQSCCQCQCHQSPTPMPTPDPLPSAFGSTSTTVNANGGGTSEDEDDEDGDPEDDKDTDTEPPDLPLLHS